jgi:hypothetical protein
MIEDLIVALALFIWGAGVLFLAVLMLDGIAGIGPAMRSTAFVTLLTLEGIGCGIYVVAGQVAEATSRKNRRRH